MYGFKDGHTSIYTVCQMVLIKNNGHIITFIKIQFVIY